MKLDRRTQVARRDVLRAGAAVATLAALPGCDAVWNLAGPQLDPLPDALDLSAATDAIDPVFHLLSRATWGPRPGDVARVRTLGVDAWLDEQIAWESIDDSPLELRLGECELIFDVPEELTSVDEKHVRKQLERAAVLRAVHSHRQLHEVMVGFWTDHLSIDAGKLGCTHRKPLDDLAVIRPHALGRFRDLIRASALSPAMLVYLNGRENRRSTPEEQPNENYARELLELHTLGVHGGYTQQDVMEAARCLTGWTLSQWKWWNDDSVPAEAREMTFFSFGKPVFRSDWHDDGEKVVLGHTIAAGGGPLDLDELLEVVCSHPATARHIATKLCRRFVADDPPASLIASTTALFIETDGDIAVLVRHVLTSAEFAASAGTKVKRPFRFVVSALRALGAEARAKRGEMEALERMGHVPHAHPTPDGYPDEAGPWSGTLLWRWNFALALTTNALGGTQCDIPGLARRAGLDPSKASPAELAPLVLGRLASQTERGAIDAYVTPGGDRVARAEGVALLLASPAFQVT